MIKPSPKYINPIAISENYEDWTIKTSKAKSFDTFECYLNDRYEVRDRLRF